MNQIVDFQGLSYAFPDAAEPVFRNLAWTVEQGMFSLLTGPSGSGKSTLLRTMIGLVPHFSGGRFGGRAVVAGLDVAQHGPRSLSNHVGFVFQDPEPQMIADRVDDEICFALEQHGVPRPVMRRRLEELLDVLGISDLRARSPRTLSGGEQQRVAIAAAMAMHPDLLVLDEPTSQLDPAGADTVIDVLGRMHRDLGLTIALSEHRLERLLDRVDQVVDLDRNGAIRAIGSPIEVVPQLATIVLPPVTQLARALGWASTPLTVHEMRTASEFPLLRDSLQGNEPSIPHPAVSPASIRLEQVDVHRGGRKVLDHLDFFANPGELIALMGRNGSGKTTLLRTLLGFERPEAGKVTIDQRESIAYLPQQPGSIFFHETVAEEVAWTLRQRGNREQERVEDVLDEFGILDKFHTHPRDLSGGERERAALATMLAGSPSVIVLDEPTRGMDAVHKDLLMTSLVNRQRGGATIIIATHDVELVARHATRVLLLGNGEIIADGHPREVLAGSLSFAPQINRVFGGTWLTVEDIVSAR
jgi:energy-coupling factor transport system ATP-binding protein